jgi:PHP family Zn ribbon phosphoesterase
LERVAPPEIVSSILKMRAGEVEIRPGYDGIYGEIKVKGVSKKEQGTLLF